MALIRCPQCNTGHELDDALFLGGSRRVRCASCRLVWVAEGGDPAEAEAGFDVDYAKLSQVPPPAAVEERDPGEAAFQPPAEQPLSEAQSQDDIDSLFAEMPATSDARPADELAAAQMAPAPPAAMDEEAPDPSERRANRRKATAAEQGITKRARSAPTVPLAAMFAAASIGTLSTLLIFRHDIARLMPWTEGIYSTIGLGTKDVGLFLEDIRSRITQEDGRDTLEVTGVILNRTNSRRMLPLMRLAVRAQNGREVYVWTATADQADIGPNDRLTFRRRLASPPPEGHSVEVRFVPAQDIVASVR